MSFYKINGESLITAPNSVHTPTITLKAEEHTTYTYPIEGWYWFNSLHEAMIAFVAQNG